MKYLAIAAILLSTAAYGQDKPADAPIPSPSPTSEAAPAPTVGAAKVFYLEVDQAELNSIATAINELPKRVADPLILKLNSQLQVQAKLAADYAAATVEPKGKKRSNSK